MRSSQVQALAEAVDRLAALEVTALSVADLQALVAAAETAANRLAGVSARALAELELRTGGAVDDGAGDVVPTVAWLRDTLATTGRQAGAQVRQALALRQLPLVRDAVVAGEISPAHARVLARLVGRFEPSLLAETEADMLVVAKACDPDRLAMWVRHLVATWCEPAFEQEIRAAYGRRYLQVVNQHDGTHRGRFVLPDELAETVLSVLEPLARRQGDEDDRTAGQRRADALADVFGLVAAHGDLPDAGGRRPQVTVVVPSGGAGCPGPAEFRRQVAAGLAEPDGALVPSSSWTGPVSRAVVDTLLCDCRLDHAYVDGTGQVVSLTAPSDTITAAQRRALAVRDRGCVARGCDRPPGFCDAHHLRRRADGGPTTLDNMVLLCRRHHTAWHRGRLAIGHLRVPWLALAPPVGVA